MLCCSNVIMPNSDWKFIFFVHKPPSSWQLFKINKIRHCCPPPRCAVCIATLSTEFIIHNKVNDTSIYQTIFTTTKQSKTDKTAKKINIIWISNRIQAHIMRLTHTFAFFSLSLCWFNSNEQNIKKKKNTLNVQNSSRCSIRSSSVVSAVIINLANTLL